MKDLMWTSVPLRIRNTVVKRYGSILFYFSIAKKAFQVWFFHQVSERQKEYPFLIQNLAARRGMRILDVGCSGSLVCHWLVNRGYEVHGVDLRPYQEKPQRMSFHQADVQQRLPFPDGYFDRIVCVSTIEHVGLDGYGGPQDKEGDLKAMQELRRILKVGGRIILTTPYGHRYQVYSARDAFPHIAWRVYDRNRLTLLSTGFIKNKEEYFVHAKRWFKVSENVVSQVKQGLACLVMEKPCLL